jgi:hypothetical protein
MLKGADQPCSILLPMSKSGLPDQIFRLASVNLQATQIGAPVSRRPCRRQVVGLERQDFAPQWPPHSYQNDAMHCPVLHLHQHQLA